MSVSATSTALGRRLVRLVAPPSAMHRQGVRYPYLLVLLLLTGGWMIGNAQSSPITSDETTNVYGRVLDAATLEPLIGTTVTAAVEEETLGTVTDFEGYYAFTLPAGQREITFYYTGYRTSHRTVVVGDDTEVDALLRKEGAEATGSNDRGSYSIVKDDGEPASILYIVDGERLEKRDVNALDPKTIEKIDVIKTPARIAEFGFGTAYDGAVVVTLKK